MVGTTLGTLFRPEFPGRSHQPEPAHHAVAAPYKFSSVASTAKSPNRFYQRVDETIEVLLALVAEGIGWATTALLHQDFDAAHRVIEGDCLFDTRCDQLTELVRQRLAGATVRADEVDRLATILQIIPELERSADLAEHIAQRSLQGLGGVISPLSRGLVQSICEATIDMWQELADAYGTRSRDAAFTLDDADAELDELCASLVSEGTSEAGSPQVAVELALIARFYERLGDHAVNLARRVDALAAPRGLSTLPTLGDAPPPQPTAHRLDHWRLLTRLRRLRLAPRDRRYFELFEFTSANTRDCAEELRKLVASGATDNDHYARIKSCERRGHELTRRLLHLLDVSFVTPYDRQDIHALVEELHDVVDDMCAAGSLLHMLQPSSWLPEITEFADLVVTMSDEQLALVGRLRSGEGARYHMERIDQLEHRVDSLKHKASQRLFSQGYDAIEILKWKDIIQAFERVADAIETVSDIVESVLIKES
jgi:predicted phosphate transport protein (TIGR00153 family)